jgi:hypothetical protein
MLDDFKTELKRLGMKRLQHDELRRQSVALVLDDNTKDDDNQLEFSDALNVNPARFQTLPSIDTNSSRSPRGRLRQDSVSESRNDSRNHVGHSGKKISRLPGLKDFKFDYKRAGKKKDKSDDEEKQGAGNDDDRAPPAAPDRLSQMRKSLGVIDYHPR